MFYSYKGNEPQILPERIRLSNGLTRTDKSTFSEEEILDAGYIYVGSKPVVNEMEEKVVWDSDNTHWKILPLSEDERIAKINERWNVIRQERDQLLKSSDIIALREIEDTGVVSEETKVYRQALRDITSQQSPLNIEWPTLGDVSQPIE